MNNLCTILGCIRLKDNGRLYCIIAEGKETESDMLEIEDTTIGYVGVYTEVYSDELPEPLRSKIRELDKMLDKIDEIIAEKADSSN